MDEGTNRRLSEIERRLMALEQRLGAILPPVAPPMVMPAEPEEIEAPIPMATVVPPPMPVATPVVHPRPPVIPPFPDNPRLSPRAEAIAPNRWSTTPPPLPRAVAPVASSANLEQTIGLKWTGWVGAIVLVIGAGLGFKYAYDQGWLGHLPKMVKLLVMIAIGSGLIAVGEYVYRRVDRFASAGLYGAGVAVLFLSGYASHEWYGVFNPTGALVMMGAVGVIGLLVAARADLVSVAVLSIIGANLAPVLLGGKIDSPAPFLAYLACLQFMALGLCAWRIEPKWWSLRTLTLITTFVWMCTVCTSVDLVLYRYTLLGFACIFWAVFQIELLSTLPRAVKTEKLGFGQRSAGVTFAFFTTVALTFWVLLIYDKADKHIKGDWLLAIAGIVGVMGFALRRVRGGVLAPLARGYRVQSVLLIVLAIPILLDGPTMLFAWMLLSIGLSLHGLRGRDRFALGGALAVWVLAGVVWLAWSDGSAARNVWLTLFAQPLEARLCMAAALMLAGHFVATAWHLMKRTGDARDASAAGFAYVIDIAALLVFGGALMVYTRPDFSLWMFILYAWTLFAASFVPILAHLGAVGLIALAMAAIKWAVADVVMARLQPGWRPTHGTLFFNLEATKGYVLAGSLGGMAWLVGRRRIIPGGNDAPARADSILAMAFTIGVVFLGFVLSAQITGTAFDISDLATANLYRNLLLTILWTTCAVAWLITLRQAISTLSLRATVQRAALMIALLLALKFMLFDIGGSYTNDVVPMLRIGLNLQVLTMLIVGGAVCLTASLAPGEPWTGLAVFAVPVLLLVTGSAEIDRYAVVQTHGPTWIVRQVGWSIYWSVLAVVTLIVGFAARLHALRYLALTLLAITLLKVVLIDMSGAGTGWRILSFLGLGLLLLATSVLYGKFGPKSPGKVADPIV